jgi:hypothetical protein
MSELVQQLRVHEADVLHEAEPPRSKEEEVALKLPCYGPAKSGVSPHVACSSPFRPVHITFCWHIVLQ